MFAKKELKEYDTGKVCSIIQVSRSSYYRVPRTKKSDEIAIETAIINCFKENERNYGRIRIKKELSKQGIVVSENKIARIFKEYGLVAKTGRIRKKKQIKPTEKQYYEENLIKNKFEVIDVNALWCSDITELSCKGGKFYACGVMDVATRRLVGWAISRNQRQQIVQDAILMAVGRNPNRAKNIVFHSDRGCQYTAQKTKELLEQHGFRRSMSRPGTPSDNQPIESFWRTLECEMPDIRHLTFDEASRELVKYIELYYNSKRLHSSIGYKTPNEYYKELTL